MAKKVKGSVWAAADVIGMAILAVGALGYIDIFTLDSMASIALIVIGIIIIIISSVFIQLDGMRLRKEHDEFRRFEEIRNEARIVPNDLNEPYQIDYTAEPSRAIIYKKNEPIKETRLAAREEPEDEVLIIYSG